MRLFLVGATALRRCMLVKEGDFAELKTIYDDKANCGIM